MARIEWHAGFKLHGFTVKEITPLPELNGVLYQLNHEKTGARLVHIETSDDNNLFGVGFHTTPSDSTGVAHILEHTVLCGSERYPVRDPFFSMLKRSLNTFMNALTASDWTLYPFSSQNEKDFYNLMGVYLDAAFFPRLRERDFRQEGHRVEFKDPSDPDSPLEFKGVVYNEMKGAMADPSSLISRRMNRALYPTTTYGHNSGGEPEAIPDLTWEALRKFHATYYHPSNAYFFTYGDFPLEGHLKAIEELALSRFEPQEVKSAVADEVRFSAPKRAVETYPIDPAESLEGKSMVQLGWLTCPIADSFERTALSLLSVLLLGNPAAPLYKALLDSKLGQNLAPGTGYHDDNRETFFAVGLQGTDPEATENIEELILATLEETAQKGFARERIEAAIHQMEFSHREVTGDQYPYALILLMRLLGPWMHADDPVSPLLLERDLARLREELDKGPFFENLLRRHLLDNTHRVTLTLKPDPSLGERQERQAAERLENIRQGLSGEEREAIARQAEELRQAQEAEEDLSVLPTLQLSDIPPQEREVPSSASAARGVPLHWFDQPTNGISYFNAHLEAADLPAELLHYAPLFCSLLTQVGAAGFSYLEMAERMAEATGGIRASSAILEGPGELDAFLPVVEVKGKALDRNRQQMFDILSDIFRAPDLSDLDRLHTVIGQVKTSLENSIPGSGHRYAARIAGAALTSGGRLREEWSGISLIRRVREIAALKPEQLDGISQKFRAIGEILLDRSRACCAVTAEGKGFAEMKPSLESFLESLPAGEKGSPPQEAPFVPRAVRRGWAASVPVSYVARVFRTVPLTDPAAPSLMVLARLLRAGFLHREIREKGGAYGGLAGFDPESGLFSMLSYRDPHLVRTLRTYRQAVEWAAGGSFEKEAIREAILSVFSDLDKPLSPGGRGSREFANIRQGLTREMRQELREGVLSVGKGDLAEAAEKYLLGGWQQSAVGVISSEEALQKANAELGEDGLEVQRI